MTAIEFVSGIRYRFGIETNDNFIDTIIINDIIFQYGQATKQLNLFMEV